jgi:GAF domain-containing protein
MIRNVDQIQEDIEKINQITIVPSMLEVVCRATGMGFAAIARVTEDRWVACSVRDEVNFGLKAGDELQLETTICNEIRQSRQGVVIDHVAADQQFCDHHTPKMYGFQSYISIPIVLNTGQFFGTLCALDKNPAKVSDLKITGMFTLFTQLIAFHLQALDALERSNSDYQNAKKENSRYEHITYHSLREPVRKISLFSDLLLQAGEKADLSKMREKAIDINRFSNELAGILHKLKEG